MKRPLAAVIGHPVDHSLSPLIFSVISKFEKQPIEYRRIDVPPRDFATFVRLGRESALFMGWNVTIPHKQSAARECDRLSPEAKASGAVNVIVFLKQGMTGFNTDILGIERTLAAKHVKVQGARAVVYGAGGAGLAAGYALAKGGAAEVVFVNRTFSRARAAALRLAKALRLGYFGSEPKTNAGTRFRASRWPASSESFGEEVDIYVNATSLGMGQRGSLDPFSNGVRKDAVAFDVVYIPEDTDFLRAARRRGLRAIGGLDMLIWQGIATWELWFGELGAGRALKIRAALEVALRAELRGRELSKKRVELKRVGQRE